MKAEILRLQLFVKKMEESGKKTEEKEIRVYSAEEETNKQKDVRSPSEEDIEGEGKDFLSEEKESTKERDVHSSSEEHVSITSHKLSEEIYYDSPTAVQSPQNAGANETFSDVTLHSNIEKENNSYPDRSRCNCSEILKRVKKFEDDTAKSFKTVMKANKKLLKAINHMNERNNKVQIGVHTFDEALEGFPLESVEQFDELENDQSKKNEHYKLYNHLCGIGASKLRDFVHMCFRQTMTDELVCTFTWAGSSDTEKLGDTKLVKIMYAALVQ
ncbi:uncharacterized protein LOC116853586 isoform X2 [Odontomachus brunneus]|uniref:uncharacterized protein LOC116853586 isoform X2 n=1 Tax=Odontomachus brunneus TaxID=486640 RepID=UPI0013F1B35C|nr:uncharacterized protein LOC116853586 isoform X2 [Odontomachus brunneus]